jgi:hypothetical protein
MSADALPKQQHFMDFSNKLPQHTQVPSRDLENILKAADTRSKVSSQDEYFSCYSNLDHFLQKPTVTPAPLLPKVTEQSSNEMKGHSYHQG